MRPASVSGYRSFLQKHFYYQTHINANKLPDLYLVILSQPVLEIHMISCYPAAPQGRKRKGANCAARVCGGSWELGAGRDSAAFLQFFGLLPLSAFACLCLSFPVSYIVLPCPVPSLYFLSVVCSCLLGLPAAAACFFFLSDFVTSGLGEWWAAVRNAGEMREI